MKWCPKFNDKKIPQSVFKLTSIFGCFNKKETISKLFFDTAKCNAVQLKKY